MLKIYNTLTKQKEEFKPIEAGKIKLYVCGITVYDYCHVGHARVFVAFDTIVRYLRNRGYEVTYVRNITDVDDKIIRRAQLEEVEVSDISERYIKAMHEDETLLKILPPSFEPRATDHILEMQAMINKLFANGYAYKANNGDIYYEVNKFKEYGKLSHQKLEDLESGIRVEIGEQKRDPLDFALWKSSKEGEPAWETPWGDGRPGWHIECSAMSTHQLGSHFDIHGGGADLKFPHHENEIAQSEGATGHKFVNYWMHVGFVEVDKVKMSKSLGNFFTLRDVFKEYHPEVVRFFLLSSHYRSPLNYSKDNLTAAKTALTRLYITLRGLPVSRHDLNHELSSQEKTWVSRFNEAMDDDFNTPEALAILFDISKHINKLHEEDKETLEVITYTQTLISLATILGLLQHEAEDFLKYSSNPEQLSEDIINQLIEKRNQARADRNWQDADKIRDYLDANNIELEDSSNGTKWYRK